MLWMFQRVYLGPITNDKNATLPDLRPREWASVLPLCALAVAMGVFPSWFLAPMELSVKKVVERVQTAQPVRAENAAGQRVRAGNDAQAVPVSNSVQLEGVK
jgi:NADH-quinone oxidoreductase subunit M